MEDISVIRDNDDILEELKNNVMMPNYLKIKTYKDYLFNEKKYYYPDMLLDWVAREHLGLQRTEEELSQMRKEYLDKVKEIEEQNKIGEEQCRRIDEENKIKII
jgi:type III secretory pathway component EscV